MNSDEVIFEDIAPVYLDRQYHFQDEGSLEALVGNLSNPTKRFHRPTRFSPEQLDLFLLRWFQGKNLLPKTIEETLQSKKIVHNLSEIRQSLFRLVERRLIEVKENTVASGRLYRLYAFPERADEVGSEC